MTAMAGRALRGRITLHCCSQKDGGKSLVGRWVFRVRGGGVASACSTPASGSEVQMLCVKNQPHPPQQHLPEGWGGRAHSMKGCRLWTGARLHFSKSPSCWIMSTISWIQVVPRKEVSGVFIPAKPAVPILLWRLGLLAALRHQGLVDKTPELGDLGSSPGSG